jgi:bifunctional non-homologous end joining protein LigD
VSLATYHKKRRFTRTPEPRGRAQHAHGDLRFVVQKHAASRLHYDFRLELDGTLKSWAIPKGPSLDPSDKRLAVMVEDHPLDYRTFEGTIPEGNYGAGTVIVWDEGTYSAAKAADSRECERLLREGLREGHLSFVLKGKKLKGEFSLVKLKRGKGNEWLLIKKRDTHSARTDVTDLDASVQSGQTLKEVAERAAGSRSRERRATPSRNGKAAPDLRGAPKANIPRQVKPMLASLVEAPFDRPGWLFEVKWDGYRAIAEVDRRSVALYSRNHQPFEHRFAPVVETLSQLGHQAVLDGEVVVVDPQGKSDFQLLQKYQKTGEGTLRYYVFDLLYLDGRDLRGLPLKRRKELLGQLLGDLPNVFLSEHVEAEGVAFFEAAAARGLEGIIAKDRESLYREGFRSRQWLKIKTHQRQEAVICGFTEPRGSRKDLGSLVLGVYEGKDLVCIGHSGGGLDTRGLSELRARLQPLVRQTCPFQTKPRTNAPVHWVTPKLVCEVSFQEWTRDGVMRQPIFLGLREDKAAHSVRRELPEPSPARRAHKKSTPTAKAGSRSRKRSTQTAASATAPEPTLTNLSKIYWPEEGYTKGDLIAYYREIAAVILPYLRDRPQSLHRHPDGIAGKSFFQKDVSRHPPPAWVQTVNVRSESSARETITYLLCQDEATLLYLANLGCIELNPWNARVESPDNPDYMIIDLDPQDVPFQKVVEAALAVRKTLERAEAPSFCKTSGKRGLHVFVPLGAAYDHEHARQFAEVIAEVVRRQLPESTSLARSPAQRRGMVYLDCLQNRRSQTLAAAYSVRPYPGATVSTPLEWREVGKRLDPAAFTIKTMAKRIDKHGDLWGPVLGPGVELTACLNRIVES